MAPVNRPISMFRRILSIKNVTAVSVENDFRKPDWKFDKMLFWLGIDIALSAFFEVAAWENRYGPVIFHFFFLSRLEKWYNLSHFNNS